MTSLCLFLLFFVLIFLRCNRDLDLGRCLPVGIVLICLKCKLCGTRSEGEKAPWKSTHFKGLLLVLLNCERNVLGFSFHCVANEVDSGDRYLHMQMTILSCSNVASL